jgi:protein TonB
MFEDSLVESTGRIRTRSSRYAAGSFVLETALVAVILLIPYLYPAALPRKFLAVPLIAPSPALAPVTVVQHPATTPIRSEEFEHTLLAPPTIPNHIATIADDPPPGLISGNIGSGPGNGAIGALPLGLSTPPPVIPVHPARPTGTLHVSSGVAAGQLIVPIQPHYPAIALATHTQGTVVVAATISTDGRVESLRVLSGPSLLVNAATEAIRQARYRPWKLNGEPVEVDTTINVIFTLGGS